MPATASGLEPPWSDIDSYYGVSLIQPIFDLPARRHLLPSVMDDPVPESETCRCPGSPEAEVRCIDVRTGEDARLCLTCAQYCYWSDSGGGQHLFIELPQPVVVEESAG